MSHHPDPRVAIVSNLGPLDSSETIEAAEASAESPPEASAEGAATGPQGASERTVSERGGAVAASDGGERHP